MTNIDGHTCIGDDGGTALRRCEKCEAENVHNETPMIDRHYVRAADLVSSPERQSWEPLALQIFKRRGWCSVHDTILVERIPENAGTFYCFLCAEYQNEAAWNLLAAGQPERQSNGCVDRDLVWRLRDALVETAKPHLPDGLSVDEAWRAVRRVLGI